MLSDTLDGHQWDSRRGQFLQPAGDDQTLCDPDVSDSVFLNSKFFSLTSFGIHSEGVKFWQRAVGHGWFVCVKRRSASYY
jgi:hypothetical protein